jgi:SAM-dependent methyltransferase
MSAMQSQGEDTAGYDRDFYANREKNKQAAKVIISIVQEYIRPVSVVDVGCATGVWLAAFKEAGVHDILGIDGDWVPTDMLEIPKDAFCVADVATPIQVGRHFDLAVCLEVVEHLPEDSAATIVRSLTELSSNILFSAAIPFQGGVGHVNEQWPDYWAWRFREFGYRPVDCIRPRIWNDARVIDNSYHFAQNVLLFTHERNLFDNARLAEAAKQTEGFPISLVHPRFFLDHADPAHIVIDPRKANRYSSLSLMMVLPLIPGLFKKAIFNRLGIKRQDGGPQR